MKMKINIHICKEKQRVIITRKNEDPEEYVPISILLEYYEYIEEIKAFIRQTHNLSNNISAKRDFRLFLDKFKELKPKKKDDPFFINEDGKKK